MGGTSYPDGRPPSHDLHRSPQRYVTLVHPQKNSIRAKYPHLPDFKQLPYPSNSRGLPAPPAAYSSRPFINSYAHLSHDRMWLESFPHINGSPPLGHHISGSPSVGHHIGGSPSMSHHIGGSPSVSHLCASPPTPNTASYGEHSQGNGQGFMNCSSTDQYFTQYPPPAVMTNPGLQIQHPIFPAQALHPHLYHPSLYNSGQMLPYVVVQSGSSDMMYSNTNSNASDMMYSNTNSNAYFDHSPAVYSSDTTNGFLLDRPADTYGHPGYTQLTSPHAPLPNVLDSYSPNNYSGPNVVPFDLPRTENSQVQPPKKLNAVKEEAHNFVASFCPHLGEKPYCLPPVKRSKHPDKSIKQLAVGMESEKRVLGSFERYFAEQQIPVMMLYHYPLTGFMQIYKQEMSSPDRDFISLPGENSRSTLTLLLLSDVFSITIVTVSIISGNSDFAYIQKGVHKAVAHIKRCSRAVFKWLTFLGVPPDVRQVIAFPNLKKVVLQRIAKDKQFQESLGSVATLHVDDLSAPFEEEWSAPEHKQRFRHWMKEKVLCHTSTLTRENLQLVVGALLSPRLSQVDFINDQSQISPITETSGSSEVTENIEDVSQLKLTIDGVTKPFDWFMDEYVTCYYPKLDEVTYRVPPIHFNIQSLRKPSEYIKITQDGSLTVEPSLISEEVKHKTLSRTDSAGKSKRSILTNSVSAEESKHSILSHSESSGKNIHEMLINNSNAYSVGGPIEKDQIHNRSVFENTLNNINKEFMPCGQSHRQLSDTLTNRHLYSDLGLTEVPANENKQNDISNYIGSSPVSLIKEKSIVEPSIRIQDSCLDSSQRDVQNQSTSVCVSSSQSSDLETSSKNMSPSETVLEKRLAATVCLESLRDVDILSEVMTKDVRADEGENRVIGALEKLGQQFGPMFIICDYQYNNYLNKLREEMFSKGETSRPIRAFGQTMRAEHDCLILHKKYGVLVVCIKAIGDNFRDWGASEQQKITSTNKILEKAVKQLKREKAMIRHVTSDLDKKLACHKLIALPNMTRASVEQALAADKVLAEKIQDALGHGAELFLCSDELPAKFQPVWDDDCGGVWSKLVSWWMQVEQLLKKAGSEVSTTIYRQIVGRYCGLLSTVEVWSPTNPRVEVRNASEAVSECAGRFCKLVLLPGQLEALCSNSRRMFLYGPPGSGKTLVLILKAREWLLAGHTVILVNCRPGSLEGFPYMYGVYRRLQEMMAQLTVHNYHLLMIRIDSLHFRAEDLAGVMPSCCIIMDEVSASCQEIIEHLCCLQVNNFWCAGIFEEDKPNTEQAFTSHKMDKIIRCPPVIQSIMKHTEQDVKIQRPYRDIYQSNFFERNSPHLCMKDAVCNNNNKSSDKENCPVLSNRSEIILNKVDVGSGQVSSPGSKSSVEVSSHNQFIEEHHEKIDFSQEKMVPESLNHRLQKYERKNENSEMSSDKLVNKEHYEMSSDKCDNKEYYEMSSDKLVNKEHYEMSSDKCENKEYYEKTSSPQERRKEYQVEVKSAPDALNERLKEKYGKRKEICEMSNYNYNKEDHTKTGCPQDQRQECQTEIKYDIDSLNKRLQKYGRKEESSDILSDRHHSSEDCHMKTNCSHEEQKESLSDLKYDLESLNQRLQKVYGKKEENVDQLQITEEPALFEPQRSCSFDPKCYCCSSAEMGLPTDGPRPYIIDHRSHSRPGDPKDCFQCGHKVAEVLESLVRPDFSAHDASAKSQQQSLHKNKLAFRLNYPGGGRIRPAKPSDSKVTLSSSVYLKSGLQAGHKLNANLDSRTLAWSDVLVVAQDMPKDCAFVAALRSRQIPVEVLMKEKTFQIEDPQMRKLFITQYREVTGLERPVIVFVPTHTSNQLQPSRSPSTALDIHLGQSIDRFSAEDRTALWHMASRSLASLLLVLP